MTPGELTITRVGPSGLMIGTPGPAPAGQVTFDIPGGRILVDPSAPEAVPACSVSRLPVAMPAIREIYGEAVAQAGQELSDNDAATEVRTSLPSTQRLDQIRRLAGVRWCRRFSPLPLDDRLLLLEELLLLGHLAGVLDVDLSWREELACICADVARRVERARHAGGGPRCIRHRGAGPEEAVDKLLAEVLELLDQPVPASHRAAVSAALQTPRRASGAPPIVQHLVGPQPVLTLKDVALFTGSDSVDWADVPRGLTSFEEDNVRWAVRLGADEVAFDVGVDGPDRARLVTGVADEVDRPPVDALAFDVYSADWPYPVLTGDLFFDQEIWSWVGVTQGGRSQIEQLRQAIAAQTSISVRVRTGCPSPAASPAGSVAYRWAGRALALSRLPKLSSRVVPRAAFAWLKAAELWAEAGDEERAGACSKAGESLLHDGPGAHSASAAEDCFRSSDPN